MRRLFSNAVVVLALLWCFPAWAQLATGESELEQGVDAYNDARYQEAIQYFQGAASLDPQNKVAHSYLANSYAQLYIPGVDTSENLQMGQAAIEQYQNVLELDPKSQDALKGIAYIDLQMKKFEEAKKYYAKAIELSPNDTEAYYTIGVIDWTQVYQPRMDLRANLGLALDNLSSMRPNVGSFAARIRMESTTESRCWPKLLNCVRTTTMRWPT